MTINLADYGIDRLSSDEQIQLAEAIWASVAAKNQAKPLSVVAKAELDQRLEAHARNPLEGISGDELIANAIARHQT